MSDDAAAGEVHDDERRRQNDHDDRRDVAQRGVPVVSGISCIDAHTISAA